MMMRQLAALLLITLAATACSSSKKANASAQQEVQATLDLVHVTDDRVKVVVKPAVVQTATLRYQMPKVIPGTYAVGDYGRYISNFKALDAAGMELAVSHPDVNTWVISDAKKLDRVTYLVDDSFDDESNVAKAGKDAVIFSPAGTNILAGQNFYLNLCGFVGYFEQQQDLPYQLTINYPNNLVGTTALMDTDPSNITDVFRTTRYADVVDNPIMYAKPDVATFTIDGMEVYLHVYSPRNTNITAKTLMPGLQQVMTAQKAFLGKINKTKRYAILIYLTSRAPDDAQGTGALEHNSSTSATFGDEMKVDGPTHTISHEFFHTLTPLHVHSKEIHYFDFNNPKMSAHLWMYEGVTEYFSSMFKVNRGLMEEEAFYKILSEKLYLSQTLYNDALSFTELSKNILDPETNKLFGNVYNKGTLIATCLDILIRDKSNGKRGLLSVMGQLSEKYGPNRPFDDDELIPVFTQLTYPEVGDFLQNHVVKGDPIDYAAIMARVGLVLDKVKTPVKMAFTAEGKTYYKVDGSNRVYITVLDGKNTFLDAIGFKDNDQIVNLRGVEIEGPLAEKYTGIMGYGLAEGDDFVAKVIRNGKTLTLTGKVKLNYEDYTFIRFADQKKLVQKDRWLKQ